MLISHLLLKNFGKFENFSCDFSPGLNLIKGPNEAGKSTLADAVTTALFINPAGKYPNPEKSVKWGSHSAPVLEIVLSADGKSYRLIKDFNKGLAELEGHDTVASEGNGHAVDDWLCRQLGIQSEEIFKATACINQGEITHIENSIEAIKDKLEALVSGGKEERAASETISRLQKRIGQITGDDAIATGEIERLEGSAKELDYNIEKLSREIAALKVKRADLIQVEMAYKNVAEDLAGRKQKFENCRKANKLEEEFLRLTREHNELELKLGEAQDALKKIKSLRDRQTDLKSIDQKDISDIEELEASLKYLRPKRRELEDETRDAKDEYDAYKIGQASIICIILGLAGVTISALPMFGILLSFIAYTWYGVAVSGLILCLGVAIVMLRSQHRSYLKERLEKMQAKMEDIDANLGGQTSMLERLLKRYGSKSSEELKRSFWQFDDVEKQVAREKELYEGLLDGKNLQELEQRLQELDDALAKNKKDKKELSGFVVDDLEIDRQGQVLGQFEERIKDLDRERQVLRHQMETAEGGAELLASYVERKEALNLQKESLGHEMERLRLTIDCINEAQQNVLVSTLEVLNARTSNILFQLTSGKYSQVRFAKSSFKFEVFSQEKNGWVNPDTALSSGTVEQIYLAARLALAGLVSGEKNSVMIFDDPFANYDEKRLENAMKVLKQLAESHQILLLTSQSHYDKWADATIAL